MYCGVQVAMEYERRRAEVTAKEKIMWVIERVYNLCKIQIYLKNPYWFPYDIEPIINNINITIYELDRYAVATAGDRAEQIIALRIFYGILSKSVQGKYS